MKIQRAVAHQLARQVVLDAAADAFGDAQRLPLIGDDALVARRRLLRVEIAAVIPLLGQRGVQLEMLFAVGAREGDRRFVLPTETFREALRQLEADTREAHFAEQRLQLGREEPDFLVALPQPAVIAPG